MTRTCILHIGMPKTGSTSIQQSLARSERLQGAAYLHSGRINSANELLAAFRADPQAVKFNRVHGLNADEVQRLARAALDTMAQTLRTGPQQRYIISAEGLINLNEAEVTALRDWLLQQVDHVQVVAYVRDAKGYIESRFQQSAKGGAARRVELSRHWPGYRQCFEPYDRVFGRENVQLWKFDPRSFPGHDVVRDFCQRLQLQLPDDDIVRANESLPFEAVSLLHLYRRHKVDKSGRNLDFADHRQFRALVKLLAGLPGRPFKFTAEAVRPLFSQFQADVEWVEARISASVSTLGPDPEGAISGEAELAHPGAATVLWLAQQTQRPAPPDPAAVSGAELADWLADWLATQPQRGPADRRLKKNLAGGRRPPQA